jgi:hypothetical protein
MPIFRRYAPVALAAVLLCGLLAEGADVLEEGKSVRILFTSGKKLSGLFVSQSGSTIRIRLKLNEKPATFNASDITSLTRDDKIYKYNSDNRRWEATEAVTVAPKGKVSPAVPATQPKGKGSPTAPATLTVTAEGVGTTPEEARTDAIREAVRKVTGALVIGTTTVENDKVIKDKVLTYSDGVIVGDSYKEVDRKKEGDIWRIKISATVINRKLAKRLVDAGFEVRKIDGEGIAAAVLSRVEARKKATELLQVALEDIPKMVVAQAAKPTDGDYDEDTGELKLTVQVTADAKKYAEALERLVAVLDKVCVDGGRFTFAGKPGKATTTKAKNGGKSKSPGAKNGGKSKSPGSFQAKGGSSRTKEGVSKQSEGAATLSLLSVEIQKAETYFGFALPEEKKGWFLWVMMSCKNDYSAVSWKVYQLDCVREDAIKHLARKPTLVVTLLDKEKNVLATREVDLSQVTSRETHGWMFHHTTTREKTVRGATMRATPNVGVAPLYLMGKSFSPVQGVKVPIKISEAALRKLGDIRCEVEFR